GTDYGLTELVKGAVDAVKKFACETILNGDAGQIQVELNKLGACDKKIQVHNATQVIAMDEHPALAVKQKKDASIVVAAKMLKNAECDAVVCAGSTGAAMTAATLLTGRTKGVERPAIALTIPGMGKGTVLMDAGANMDAKPFQLLQDAIMGSVYAEKILHIVKPRVGLLSVGTEDSKGNEQVQSTFPLLKNCSLINFLGNVEGRDITSGTADVVVCDGFVGNTILKFGEGLAKTIFTLLKESILTSGIFVKVGGGLIRPAVEKLRSRMDPNKYGGALLLGIKAPFVICHGNSKAHAITNAIGTTIDFIQNNVCEVIAERIQASNEALTKG
ncbi:MAG: phosphate acyltransferase PlsX, partial [Phascolarctobacterium sp.]|nr:phosphate acyltransferase PlsX [Candidatus Phascolarctobacterium caballi]